MTQFLIKDIEDLAKNDDILTIMNCKDPVYIRDFLMKTTKIDYKKDSYELVQFFNLAYLIINAPQKYQPIFLMEYGRMVNFLVNGV